jgi:GNAT superfamily N-acetyltransferase
MGDHVLQAGGRHRATEVVVRKAGAADATAVSELLRCAFTEFETLYTPEAFVATVLPDSRIIARLEEGPLWVAEKLPSLIGTVGAIRASDSVLVRGMAVHPSARGLGVGKFLLDQVERFAREEGVRLMTLYTTPFLDRAIHLYQAAGFTYTGEKANPHGTELLRMTKVLTHEI